MPGTCVRWSAEEDAILGAVYPHHGVEGVQEVLPHRTVSAIRLRAAQYVNTRKLPKAQRSAKCPEVLAAEVRARFAKPKGKPLTKPASTTNASAKKADTMPISGLAGSEGIVQAIRREGAQAVPERAIGMPWVKYPKTVEDCRGVILRCTYLLDEWGSRMSAGERAFFETSCEFARATLANLERIAA